MASSSCSSFHGWSSRHRSWEYPVDISDGDDEFFDAREFFDDDFDEHAAAAAAEKDESPEAALIDELIDHYLTGRLSAKQTCTLFWHIERCGVSAAKPFSYPRGKPSGHYSRKLRAAVGHMNSDMLYQFNVPSYSKRDMERSIVPCNMLPLHEQLALHMEDEVGLLTRVQQMSMDAEWPAVYRTHPVVTSNSGRAVIPYAIFVDGVPYANHDSVIGWWAICLVTQKRFLVATLRKRCICRCGCRGWCSLFAIHQAVAFSIKALASGIWPNHRHDGEPWRPEDRWRRDRAGTPLSAPMACLFFKGDWAEYAHTFALATWQDSLRPCFHCLGYGPDLYNPFGNSASSLRWVCSAAGDYLNDCLRSERKVVISSEDVRSRILNVLEYDTRKDGNHGRCLTEDLLDLGLLRGDRLEPSDELPDIGAFKSATIGSIAIFWRRSEESLARHRNPCFMPDMGLDVDRCLSYDVLHCIHLGVLNTYCAIALWQIIDSGVFGAAATNDSLIHVVSVLRNRLVQFYKDHKEEGLTEVQDLTVGMLSPRESNVLHTKGAETYGVFKFILYILDLYGAAVSHRDLLYRAAKSLDCLLLLWRKPGWVMSEEDIEVLVHNQTTLKIYLLHTPFPRPLWG